jgi:galactose mutarotase-like enzyme
MAQGIQQAGGGHDHPAHDGAGPGPAERLTVGSDRLTVAVKTTGAELCSLRDAAGREFLWGAGEAWPRHAPILFPIVGRLHGDTLVAGGQRFPMGQHGFARDLPFQTLEHGPSSCRLLLTDGPATWDAYPFPFRLEVTYAVARSTVSITFLVTNPGETPLPFSVGAHPAFVWPLPGSTSRNAHQIEFEQDEPGPCFRPGANGLLDPTPGALPMKGRVLGLREEIFNDGALILLAPASRRLRFAARGAPAIEVAWQGMEQLGIWTKPGAGFLCIEPWAGYADVAGYETEVWYKPGIQILHPGESQRFLHRITVAE